jgi:hypothetical protein
VSSVIRIRDDDNTFVSVISVDCVSELMFVALIPLSLERMGFPNSQRNLQMSLSLSRFRPPLVILSQLYSMYRSLSAPSARFGWGLTKDRKSVPVTRIYDSIPVANYYS